VRPEPPTVDPGSYPTMPSGLAGHDGHEQAMPSGRPSGLPALTPEPFPTAPAAPGSTPSGLPLRGPAHAEPPAGPAAQPGQSWRSDRTEQFPAAAQPATRFAAPPETGERADGFRHTAQYFEQAQAVRGRQPGDSTGRHGRHSYDEPEADGPFEQMARHGYPEEPVAGQHWRQDPESYSYRPAHSDAYAPEPETHPADWPPFPR